VISVPLNISVSLFLKKVQKEYKIDNPHIIKYEEAYGDIITVSKQSDIDLALQLNAKPAKNRIYRLVVWIVDMEEEENQSSSSSLPLNGEVKLNLENISPSINKTNFLKDSFSPEIKLGSKTDPMLIKSPTWRSEDDISPKLSRTPPSYLSFRDGDLIRSMDQTKNSESDEELKISTTYVDDELSEKIKTPVNKTPPHSNESDNDNIEDYAHETSHGTFYSLPSFLKDPIPDIDRPSFRKKDIDIKNKVKSERKRNKSKHKKRVLDKEKDRDKEENERSQSPPKSRKKKKKTKRKGKMSDHKLLLLIKIAMKMIMKIKFKWKIILITLKKREKLIKAKLKRKKIIKRKKIFKLKSIVK